MQKHALTLCGTTGVLAAFGAFFRWLQNQASFEPETGLAVRGSLWLYVAAVWIALAAAVLGFRCLRIKNQAQMRVPETFSEAMGSADGAANGIAAALGLLMALGGILLFLLLPATETYRTLLRILALFAIGTGVAFPLQIHAASRPAPFSGSPVLAALPIVCFAFWLIVSYKIHIIDPTISAYAVEILALCCAAVAFYQLAGFTFGRPKAIRAVYFAQLGAFLCLMTLADSRALGAQLVLASAAGMLLLQSWLVVTGIRPIGGPETPEA